MTDTETQLEFKELSPFFQEINKYDEPKSKQISQEDELVGKASNRNLDAKWDVKIQIAADFFTKTFGFITSMGYNVIFGLSERTVKIYKRNPGNTFLTYITIDKTEMSEYINHNFAIEDIMSSSLSETKEKVQKPEQTIYVELDFLDEIYINSKYPVDLYFDTKDQRMMYIVNAKTIESRRLADELNDPQELSIYQSYYDRLLASIKNENSISSTYNYPSLSAVLTSLERKKSKKDKSTQTYVTLKIAPSETEFYLEYKDKTKTSSIQLYGDDISIRPLKEASSVFELDFFVKFKRIELSSNVTFHMNNGFLIVETRLGAGKIRVLSLLSPRVESE